MISNFYYDIREVINLLSKNSIRVIFIEIALVGQKKSIMVETEAVLSYFFTFCKARIIQINQLIKSKSNWSENTLFLFKTSPNIHNFFRNVYLNEIKFYDKY